MASYKNISSFTRCSRRVFLCAYGELGYERDGVMLRSSLVLVEEVLIVFLPLVPVNDTGFETSAEGLENFFVL